MRILFALLVPLFLVADILTANAKSFNYDKAWKQVEKAEIAMPQTAKSKVLQIASQAKKEGNELQSLHCILEKELLDDNYTLYVNELNQFADSANDVVIKSMAYYMLGDWLIKIRRHSSNSSSLSKYPDDINLWTYDMCSDSAFKLWQKALEPVSILKSKAFDKYNFFPDDTERRGWVCGSVYDVLVYSMCWCDLSMTKDFIEHHSNDISRDLLIYLECECFKSDVLYRYSEDLDVVHRAYRKLLQKYAGDEASNHIRADFGTMIVNDEMPKVSVEKADSLAAEVLQLIEEGERLFPNYKYNDLKELSAKVHQQTITLKIGNQWRKNEPLKLSVSYRNMHGPLTFTINADENSHYSYHKTYTFHLNSAKTGARQDTVFTLDGLTEYGEYVYTYKPTDRPKAINSLKVTDMLPIFYSAEDLAKPYRVYALQSSNGQPIVGADVQVQHFAKADDAGDGKNKENDKLVATDHFTTNADGFVDFFAKSGESIKYQIKNGGDVFTDHLSVSEYDEDDVESRPDRKLTKLKVITDKSVYRPGQTVNYKVIAYTQEGNIRKICSHSKINIQVMSPYDTPITELEDTTNEFGSMSGSFILPKNCLSGRYYIKVKDEREDKDVDYFSVEEYKLPTFDVKFSSAEQNYALDDTIKIQGNVAYLMGSPLANAKVVYSVEREPYNYCYWQEDSQSDFAMILNDTILTDSTGGFTVTFIADTKGITGDYYSYNIKTKVTSLSGETQEADVRVHAGKKSVVVHADLKDYSQPTVYSGIYSYDQEEQPKNLEFGKLNQCDIHVFNVSGVALLTDVKIQVYKQNRLVAEAVRKSDSTGVCHTDFDTRDWQSGLYKFVFTVADAKGQIVTAEEEVRLYRYTDASPFEPADLQIIPVTGKQVIWGDTIHVRIGSSLKDRYVICQVESLDGILTQQVLHVDSSYADFLLPFTKECGQVLKINAYSIDENKTLMHSYVYYIYASFEHLHLKLTSFRDKTQTGAKENWTLNFQEKDKKAELVAGMYNASLDDIYEGLGWCRLHYVYRNYWEKEDLYYDIEDYSNYTHSGEFEASLKPLKDTKWRFQVFWYNIYPRPVPTGGDFCILGSLTRNGGGVAGCYGRTVTFFGPHPAVNANAEPQLNSACASSCKLRSDFSDVAFFYPNLYADKDGDVNISFTMPEALTKWKFKALVHSADLGLGYVEKEISTQKPFMVMPTLPRFIRQGDKCNVVTGIVNQSAKLQSGVATLQLTDPLTNRVITSCQSKFTVGTGSQTSVNFLFDAPADLNMVCVKIEAGNNDYSDGEQVLLPVLTDRVQITQAMPMVVKGDSVHHFTFKALKENHSSTLQNNLLKFEFCPNPLWYAIQALPDLQTLKDENCTSLLSAYFSSMIAVNLAKYIPDAEQVIRSWKQTDITADGLHSALANNLDVKNILLEETPWLLDAKNETEQKQRLALLYDKEKQTGRLNDWTNHLTDLQNYTGALCWFKGGNESLELTLEVLQVRLETGCEPYKAKSFCTKAIKYVDNWIREQFETVKKNHPKDYKKYLTLDSDVVKWLRLRNFYKYGAYTSDNPEVKEAYDCYLSLASDEWRNMTYEDQADIALAYMSNGKSESAYPIIKSLREHEVECPDFGITLKGNTSISTHAKVMVALKCIDKNNDEINRMCIWLLNQKRGNKWSDDKSTMSAVYALMQCCNADNDTAKLSSVNMLKLAKVGQVTVQADGAEAGTGYFTQTFVPQQISANMADVQIQKNDSSYGWGSMYWQYTEQMQKVQSANSDLQIDKMLTLEQQVAGKTVLMPITGQSKVKVGDKLVVRLVVRSNRDLSYVCLKDQRSACMEPVDQISKHCYSSGLYYYQVPKDASMLYFIESLPKGTYVLEYPVYVTHSGTYQNGVATIQCMYESAFTANSASAVLKVADR